MARQHEIQYVNFYTAGSAAYQIHVNTEKKKPVRNAAPMHKPQKRQKLVIRLDPLAACGVVVAFVMLIMMVTGVVKLNQTRQEAAALESYIISLENEKIQLEDTYRNGYDIEEIRNIAEAMGMVPITQVEHMQVTVVIPPEPVEPTAWEEFCAFLAGLFA